LSSNVFPNANFQDFIQTLQEKIGLLNECTTPTFKNKLKSFPYDGFDYLHLLCKGLKLVTAKDWKCTYYFSFIKKYLSCLKNFKHLVCLKINQKSDDILLLKNMLYYWTIILPNVDNNMGDFCEIFDSLVKIQRLKAENTTIIQRLKAETAENTAKDQQILAFKKMLENLPNEELVGKSKSFPIENLLIIFCFQKEKVGSLENFLLKDENENEQEYQESGEKDSREQISENSDKQKEESKSEKEKENPKLKGAKPKSVRQKSEKQKSETQKLEEPEEQKKNYTVLLIKQIKSLVEQILYSKRMQKILFEIVHLKYENLNIEAFCKRLRTETHYFLKNYYNILIPYSLPPFVSGLTSWFGVVFLQTKIASNEFLELKSAAYTVTIVHEFIHWLFRRINKNEKITTTLSPSFDDYNNEKKTELLTTNYKDEAGRLLEALLFGGDISTLYYSQAKFLLKTDSWKLKLKTFQSNFKSLGESGIKENEPAIHFKESEKRRKVSIFSKEAIEIGECWFSSVRKNEKKI